MNNNLVEKAVESLVQGEVTTEVQIIETAKTFREGFRVALESTKEKPEPIKRVFRPVVNLKKEIEVTEIDKRVKRPIGVKI